MRHERIRRVKFPTLLFCVGLASLRAAEPISPPPLRLAENPAALAAGSAAAKGLSESLRERLLAAMASGDHVAAVQACSAMAMPLTHAESQKHPTVVELRRVTMRPRNPANAADAMDAQVLAALSEQKTPTPLLVERTIGNQNGLALYTPIRMQPLCLSCHGPRENLPENLQELLSTLYPNDRAFNYADGDFRGAVRSWMPSK
jgi:hypothetical protein